MEKNNKQNLDQDDKDDIEETNNENEIEKLLESIDVETKRQIAVSEISTCSPKRITVENVEIIEGYTLTGVLVAKTYVADIFKAELKEKQSRSLVVKMINLNKIVEDELREQIREHGAKILDYIRQNPFKNIVKIHDIFLNQKKTLLIVEEYLNVPLPKFLRKAALKKQKFKTFSQSLASAINFLHCNGIAHQNISAHNICIDSDGTLKLTSLEFAIICYDCDHDEVILQKRTSSIENSPFVAPEVINDEAYDPTKADVYSYGIILCFMILKKYPYDSQTEGSKKEQWASAMNVINDFLTKLAKDLLVKCIETDANKRISTRELVVHPYFMQSLFN
ncbi:CBL-interacting protein kinase 4-like protein [Dinothrombium tinctorium]|uniref:CBL-interacting protein kinase 4-like protein n=1 Tax=Dinothrombium tinctorium TaxID=1965070 RepID=A0A443QMW9_9ACAR|nr:CBL-interacting protein kinase 4-like protein [Dinothrombium tinctorium]